MAYVDIPERAGWGLIAVAASIGTTFYVQRRVTLSTTGRRPDLGHAAAR